MNPFATRFTKPGEIPFFFPENESALGVFERLRENQFRGQIVGPHGSGKTALTYALRPWLDSVFEETRRVVLRKNAGAVDVKTVINHRASSLPDKLLIVDGIESLSWLNRQLLVRASRNWGGLLVTTHRRIAALPVLIRLAPDLEMANRIVSYLQRDSKAVAPIERAHIEAAFLATDGNIREMVMRLYDIAENRVVI